MENQGLEIEKIQAELFRKSRELEELQKVLAENQRILTQTQGTIEGVQASKTYRVALLLKRFKMQFVKGSRSERKDFLRWAWAKLRGRMAGKTLRTFDQTKELTVLLAQQKEQNRQSLSSLNMPGLIPKTGRQIFIFGGVPFYDVGGGQRSAQLANAFHSMGYEVHYFYRLECGEADQKAMYIPASRHLNINNYSIGELEKTVREGAVFIFEVPFVEFVPYLDYANAHGFVTVYEHIDNWDSSLGYGFYTKEIFQHFIDTAKYVTVTAKVLGEKIEEVGRTDYLYCANAVDSFLFEPTQRCEKPSDLVIGKKTLLYFGSLWGEWFDWDTLIYVAEHADCEINLIGDYASITDRIKALPKNFHFLGSKRHDELPAYLRYSDITLLPFKNGSIGKYVSPLKIFEYIAMNKPVLATPLDDIVGYPNMVCSEDPKEWVRAVNQGIETVDATVFTAENSWYARCNKLLDYVGRDKKYPSISIIVSNRNNGNVIFRCVSSLLAFSGAYAPEIIVVDNDSTDGSCERLQEEFGERMKLVKSNGSSSARNLGVKAATGEILLFLDGDQWAAGEHYMDAGLDLLLGDPAMGAVGGTAGWFNKESLDGPCADDFPNKGLPAAWILCRKDIAYLGDKGLLIRRSLFEEVGGFDESFDLTGVEDVDLSLKIRHAGYELAYCPYMGLMRLPHQTTQPGSDAHEKLIRDHGDYFMKKWREIEPALLEYYI